jgi:hypothetical protein
VSCGRCQNRDCERGLQVTRERGVHRLDLRVGGHGLNATARRKEVTEKREPYRHCHRTAEAIGMWARDSVAAVLQQDLRDGPTSEKDDR